MIGVIHQAFPGAFHAARVHVDLDEAVHRVDAGIAVLHPRNVEGFAIGVIAGLIELDQGLERVGQRRRREADGITQVFDHAPELAVVKSANLVDLLDDAAVSLDDARVQRVALVEAFEVDHVDADIEVVGARFEDVLVLTRGLERDHRLEVGIEEHARVFLDSRRDGLDVLEREISPVAGRDLHRLDQPPAIEVEQELPRGEVVVRTGVDPEQLGVTRDFLQRVVRDAGRVPQDLFEQAPHAEVETMTLVIIDIAPGDRRSIQVINHRLLVQRQRVEAVRIQLNHGRIVNLLEQIRPRVGWRLRHRCRVCSHLRNLRLITERLPSARASAPRRASPTAFRCAASAPPAPRFRRARDRSSSAAAGTCAATG